MALLRQTYQTDIFDERLGLTLRVITVPPSDPIDLALRTLVEVATPIHYPEKMPHLLMAALFTSRSKGEFVRTLDSETTESLTMRRPIGLRRDAEFEDPGSFYAALTYEPLIPIEESPLEKIPLATISTSGPAFVIALSGRPTLAFAYGGTLIFLHAVQGVSEGLRSGLRELVHDLVISYGPRRRRPKRVTAKSTKRSPVRKN